MPNFQHSDSIVFRIDRFDDEMIPADKTAD